MRSEKPILLVEDDYIDTMIVKRALKEIHVTNPLNVVENGEEALTFLRDERNERPCLILLDLNMPKMDGLEFLKIVKADEATQGIPVAVLSTSMAGQDYFASVGLGAAGYLVKPVNYSEFVEALRMLTRHWVLNEPPE